MDNSSKPIESSGAYGIPKWIMKKGMRYEVDDFIVSPPTDEDGGFMRLRYGRCPSPRRQHHYSSEDSTQQSHLGITVQVVENSSVISSPDPSAPTIKFGPGVLSAEVTPITTPATSPTLLTPALTPGVSPTPFASIPLTPGTSPTPLTNAPLSPALSPTHTPVSTPESALTSPQLSQLHPLSRRADPLSDIREKGSLSSPEDSPQLGPTASVITRSLRKITTKTHPARESRLHEGELIEKGELLDSIKSLSVGGTPEATPVHTPKSSPLTQRKVLGVAMENPRRQVSAHSYFCTKPFQQNTENQPGDSESSGRILGYLSWGSQENKPKISKTTDSEAALSSAVRNRQLQDGAQTAQALDISGSVIAKKQSRPKPSKLREMNFWAPTSM